MPRTADEPPAAPASPLPSSSAATNSSSQGSQSTTGSSTHNGSTTRGPLSLPLLEGLRCRPGASDLCFQQAMKNYSSALAIARFVQSKRGTMDKQSKQPSRKRSRRRKSKEEAKRSLSTATATTSSKKQSYHWLISCLQSHSLAERKAAFGVLCAGCSMDKHTLWQVLQLLANLLQQQQSRGSNKLATKLPILTLFQHVALQCLTSDEQFALWIHPTMGLAWWSDWLWHLSIGLDETNHPCEQQHQADLMSLLVGLMYGIGTNPKLANKRKSGDEEGSLSLRYLWNLKQHSIDATAKQQQGNNKTPSKEAWSPLAALIGSYHLCKTNPVLKAAIKESTLEHWKQLVDPAFVGIDPSSSTSTRTSGKRPKRLMDTFGDPKESSSSSSGSAPPPSPSASSWLQQQQGRNPSSSARLSSPSTNSAAGGGPAFPFSRARRRLEDRSAAATVARIFSAVYGNDPEEEDDEVARFLNRRRQQQESLLEDHNPPRPPPPPPNDDDGEDNKSEQDEDEVEEDEEIDSDEAEGMEDGQGSDNDDDDEDSDDDDSDDDDEDDDEEEEEEDGPEEMSVHGIEAEVLESGLLDYEDIVVDEDPPSLLRSAARRQSPSASAPSTRPTPTQTANPRYLEQKRRIYVVAAMQVLKMEHPALKVLHQLQQSKVSSIDARKPGLTVSAEHSLMTSIVNIVQPPKKPPNSKIILRRAPTQEEFFRGSLSKNPVSLSMLRSHENKNEPTVKDLRQHIANDLQMSDSAELLELLCANKILDVDLKLRVVHQVVWKDHLIENSNPSGSQSAAALSSFLGGVGRGGRSFISSGAGLSVLFGSGMERSLLGMPSSTNVTADTPLSALPPMILTYRLIGVDGEATEDTVNTLQDPEAPSETATPEEVERMMEQKFGVTRTVTEGRGVFCLLKSIERNIDATLLKIRRDDVTEIGSHARRNTKNPSREAFKSSSPYPGLELLWCCSKLPSNRKLLLQSRAPTVLLRLLLDVLHALEEDGKGGSVSESNSTAKSLQKAIEVLASDMVSSQNDATMSDMEENCDQEDASTLRLLLTAIETSSLSRPLRNVIAKLLPYLTYGQASLCKELANEFMRHVSMDQLAVCEIQPDVWDEESRYILPATCVHASCSLPENPVCDSLRVELVNCGFVERLAKFLLESIPSQPPSWSPSLWAKDMELSEEEKTVLEAKWQEYLGRPGLKTAFNMLIGLSKSHGGTQLFIGNIQMDSNGGNRLSLIQVCHWIESTSDSSRVSTNGLGIVAETLLDELAKEEKIIAPKVKAARRSTRDRKKEIAMARRNKALQGMGSFGPIAASPAKSSEKPSVRSRTAASLLAPVLGIFGNDNDGDERPSKRAKKTPEPAPSAKPAWMMEMENMEDEDGLTCAVCQEGRTLQPAELLGLYAYVKKVSLSMSQCGCRNAIDGTDLLTSLPSSMPESLSDTHAALEWFPPAKKSGDELRVSSRSSSLSSSSRKNTYTTTVTAGNAIHFSCHSKARQADKNHPKAPKSEWEGASLRNSRVQCNVMLPLVSSRSSKVPLVAVDSALTDHQTAVSNLLNARPKSMLWTVLHDVRLLLLRIAYGEQLNADCGGGSLSSNSRLVYYQLLTADMFAKDAEVDSPQTARHASTLSGGFLAACAMINADDYDKRKQTLVNRGIADSSLMAALTCILFHNTTNDYNKSKKSDDNAPNNKRRWVIGKESFLRGLINCAGRRHALGLEDSGCVTNRTPRHQRGRSSSFADWDVDEDEDILMRTESVVPNIHLRRTPSGTAGIEDFRNALRPMIVFFAMMDQISADFCLNMDDAKVEECGDRLTQVIQDCQRASSIGDLLQKAGVSLDNAAIMEELQRGILSA